MTSPRKTRHDLESTGDTLQVIGTVEKGDLECITVKIITVCFCHSLAVELQGGLEHMQGPSDGTYPNRNLRTAEALRALMSFRAQGCWPCHASSRSWEEAS